MSTKENPLVSIIIPLFNRRPLIGETLASIQAQSYTNWEAVVVDDGSNDGSFAHVQELACKDSRIKLLKRNKEPKGAPVCRNIGISQSKGEYVIFLDSDDLLAPYCLNRRIGVMKGNPELDFAVFHVILFYKKPGDSRILWNVFSDENDMYRFLNSDTPWLTSSPIWKRNFLIQIGGWDEEAISWQDWEFHIRALSLIPKYKKFDDIPDSFLRRDDHTRISRGDKSGKSYFSRIRLFQKIYELLSSKNQITPAYKKVLAAHYFKLCEKAVINDVDIDLYKIFYPALRDGLIKRPVFLLCLIYFYSLRIVRKSTLFRIFCKRYILPNYLFHKNYTYNNRGLDTERFEKLKTLVNFKPTD